MTEHNGWVKFTALVAIGFYDQVSVIDLSSSDQNADNALLMVDEDLRELAGRTAQAATKQLGLQRRHRHFCTRSLPGRG